MNIIEEFYINYCQFVERITTGNKKQFNSIDTINAVNDVLVSLIKLVEANEDDKIDKYMIYNTILVSKLYINRIPVEPDIFTPRKIPMMNLKNNLKKLEELNIKEENYKSRR